jgi:transcriptional regulator with XRE-family HTH domain
LKQRTSRLAATIAEQRADLNLSLRDLERLSGVSRPTITKLERGGHIDPALAVRIAAALIVIELTTPLPDPSSNAQLTLPVPHQAWAAVA